MASLVTLHFTFFSLFFKFLFFYTPLNAGCVTCRHAQTYERQRIFSFLPEKVLPCFVSSPTSLYNPEYVTNVVDLWPARVTTTKICCVSGFTSQNPFSSERAAVKLRLSSPVSTDTAAVFNVM
jgi:hypothetical protein